MNRAVLGLRTTGSFSLKPSHSGLGRNLQIRSYTACSTGSIGRKDVTAVTTTMRTRSRVEGRSPVQPLRRVRGERGMSGGPVGMRKVVQDEIDENGLGRIPDSSGPTNRTMETNLEARDEAALSKSSSSTNDTASTSTSTSPTPSTPPPPAPLLATPPPLTRPQISPSHVPFLPPSALNLPFPPYPPTASSIIRELLADFLSSEQAGHVPPPPATTLTPEGRGVGGWRILYWRGKQLFKFYWAGCKSLRANFRDMRLLSQGRERGGWVLSRREKRFMERTRSDLWKIVPFVFFLMTVEEILPLMVLYTPWVLPSTTILPSQFLRIKSQSEITRRQGLIRVGKAVSSLDVRVGDVYTLQGEVIRGLCETLDLGTTRLPPFWLRSRISGRIRDIVQDDLDLLSSRGTEALVVEEKRLALGDRGQLALRTPLDQLDVKLDTWLDAVRGLDREKHEGEVLRMILGNARELYESVRVVDEAAGLVPPGEEGEAR